MGVDYVDVALFDMMDEPAEISFYSGDKTVPTRVVSSGEQADGDGYQTVYRIQLADLEKL